MSLTSAAAKAAAMLPIRPKSSSELNRFPGSTFDKIRKKGEPIIVLAPLANVTGSLMRPRRHNKL